jgi:hypothetical protein
MAYTENDVGKYAPGDTVYFLHHRYSSATPSIIRVSVGDSKCNNRNGSQLNRPRYRGRIPQFLAWDNFSYSYTSKFTLTYMHKYFDLNTM